MSEQKPYDEIPVELIDIGKEQVRVRGVEEELDELIENIQRFTMLHPPIVYHKNGRFKLIAGQRRLIAARRLGWERIWVHIVPEPIDILEAKAISFSETFVRRDLESKDVSELCLDLYHKYGTIKRAADELGLPYYRVRNYVKYEMLPKELQGLVDDRRVTLNEAIRAAKLSELPDGTFNVERAITFALEMKLLSPEQRHRLEELQRERPGASAEELVEEAKKTRRTERVIVVLAAKWIDGLDKAAEDMARSREEIAGFAIMDWLSVKGYV